MNDLPESSLYDVKERLQPIFGPVFDSMADGEVGAAAVVLVRMDDEIAELHAVVAALRHNIAKAAEHAQRLQGERDRLRTVIDLLARWVQRNKPGNRSWEDRMADEILAKVYGRTEP